MAKRVYKVAEGITLAAGRDLEVDDDLLESIREYFGQPRGQTENTGGEGEAEK